MNEKFFDLKKEKQNRIINSALKRFAIDGYKDAGTDEIVRDAGISKGLLFHYFGNKQGLYAFVYEYAVRYLSLELDSYLEKGVNNPFMLARQVLRSSASAMEAYPFLIYFLYCARKEQSEEANEAAAASILKMQQLHVDFRIRVNFSKYTNVEESDRAWKMIDHCVYAQLDQMLFDYHPFDAMDFYKEICAQLDLLERAVLPAL